MNAVIIDHLKQCKADLEAQLEGVNQALEILADVKVEFEEPPPFSWPRRAAPRPRRYWRRHKYARA